MGLIIEASSIYEGSDDQGSIDLAVQAAKKCIDSGNINVEDIGILINIGIYREENIVEPAIAKLIQKNLRINLDPLRKTPVGKTTFCFDLINGPCGFLNAVQIVDSFMKTNHNIKYALIVSGDVHPSKKQVSDFPYSHYGAAVILTKSSEKGKGFRKIIFRTSDDDNYTGVFGYHDIRKYGKNGRYNIAVEVAEDYKHRLEDFTIETINEYIKSENLNLSNSALITSQPTHDFGKRIIRMVGGEEKDLINIYEKYGDSHSSALSLGYHIIKESIKEEKDKILFVGASAGLTAACGLYVL